MVVQLQIQQNSLSFYKKRKAQRNEARTCKHQDPLNQAASGVDLTFTLSYVNQLFLYIRQETIKLIGEHRQIIL